MTGRPASGSGHEAGSGSPDAQGVPGPPRRPCPGPVLRAGTSRDRPLMASTSSSPRPSSSSSPGVAGCGDAGAVVADEDGQLALVEGEDQPDDGPVQPGARRARIGDQLARRPARRRPTGRPAAIPAGSRGSRRGRSPARWAPRPGPGRRAAAGRATAAAGGDGAARLVFSLWCWRASDASRGVSRGVCRAGVAGSPRASGNPAIPAEAGAAGRAVMRASAITALVRAPGAARIALSPASLTP